MYVTKEAMADWFNCFPCYQFPEGKNILKLLKLFRVWGSTKMPSLCLAELKPDNLVHRYWMTRQFLSMVFTKFFIRSSLIWGEAPCSYLPTDFLGHWLLQIQKWSYTPSTSTYNAWTQANLLRDRENNSTLWSLLS